MIILTIFFLILSISLNIRRDITISYTRIGTLMQIYCIYISYNNLYISYLYEGVGLFGGLFNISSISIIFHLLIFLLSLMIINLTGFYSIKSKWNILISNVKYILLKERKKIKSVKYTLNKLFSHVPGLPDICRKYLVKSWPFFLLMVLVIISFVSVGLCLIDTCLFNTVLFRNILTIRLTSFYSLKSKFNILISKVKSILAVRQIITFVKCTLNKLLLNVTGITKICWGYLLKGLQIFFYMALGILYFLLVGFFLVDMWLINSVLFWNIFPICQTSFYSLKSKFNRLISKVKSIIIWVDLLIFMFFSFYWIDIFVVVFGWLSLIVPGITKICWESLIKGLQNFFLIVLLGLGFIFWFNPLLFKSIFLLLTQLLNVYFELPSNIYKCDSNLLFVKVPNIFAPGPKGSLPTVYITYDNGNTDEVYPGNNRAAHYIEKVNAFRMLDPQLRQGIYGYSDFECLKKAQDIYLEGIKETINTSRHMNLMISKFKELINPIYPNILVYNGPSYNDICPLQPGHEYWSIEYKSSTNETYDLKKINREFIRFNWLTADLANCIEKVQNSETYCGTTFTNPQGEAWRRANLRLKAVCEKGTPAEILKYANANRIDRMDTEFFKLPLDFHS